MSDLRDAFAKFEGLLGLADALTERATPYVEGYRERKALVAKGLCGKCGERPVKKIEFPPNFGLTCEGCAFDGAHALLHMYQRYRQRQRERGR